MVKKFEIWLANLQPGIGTEPGKIRPVLVVQTDFLNDIEHPSTLICPLTSKIKKNAYPLRVFMNADEGNLIQNSDILIDQLRAIDNRRFIRLLSVLPEDLKVKVVKAIKIVLDVEPFD